MLHFWEVFILRYKFKAMSSNPFFSSVCNNYSLLFRVEISCPFKWSLFIEADSFIVFFQCFSSHLHSSVEKKNWKCSWFQLAFFYWTLDSLFHVCCSFSSLFWWNYHYYSCNDNDNEMTRWEMDEMFVVCNPSVKYVCDASMINVLMTLIHWHRLSLQ